MDLDQAFELTEKLTPIELHQTLLVLCSAYEGDEEFEGHLKDAIEFAEE